MSMSTKRSREESVSPTCLPTCSVRRPTYEKVALKDRAGPEDVDSALIFGQTMLHGQPALRKDNVDGTWLRHTSSLVCSLVFLSSIVFFPLLLFFFLLRVVVTISSGIARTRRRVLFSFDFAHEKSQSDRYPIVSFHFS